MAPGKDGGSPRNQQWAGRLHLQPEALVDEDPRVARKVLKLMEAARRSPHEGEGKPEPLRHLGPDIWSRRITQEARLV